MIVSQLRDYRQRNHQGRDLAICADQWVLGPEQIDGGINADSVGISALSPIDSLSFFVFIRFSLCMGKITGFEEGQ